MDSKTMTRLSALLLASLVASATRTSTAADPPTPAQALSLTPMQSLVEYTIPNKEDAAQCTVKLEKENKVSTWVVPINRAKYCAASPTPMATTSSICGATS